MPVNVTLEPVGVMNGVSFKAGLRDALNGGEWPDNYETWDPLVQYAYEWGRQFAALHGQAALGFYDADGVAREPGHNAFMDAMRRGVKA